MKKLLFLGLLPIIALADCASLMAKYEAPEPESKTMKQIERWINKKVKDANDAAVLKECMVARAADNPNQVSVAGK
ncbi:MULTISPECIES: hypothetical protein [Campylobacter]|uniref:Periplasmic protein n=1 Tax=Campylobacter taeniopygiae TaxID=2510188 RepID=A0ABY2TK92_9BACT|nr:hypothetical protein [Campylobacter taeniopygiae]MBZ7935245.1 hypothetical protein [Campylobacter sp. B0100352/1]MBZ7963634.1 hypothetical protein [Campylobacter sp. 2457A]TKX34257.1 hypothetical protein CQA75_02605 [Campylobacter taeniopygiae]